MHLMTSAKNDIAALELTRQIDLKWDTAWLIKQKLVDVMRQRNSIYKLSGELQIDDAYQGGEKAGKPERRVGDAPSARCARNKVPIPDLVRDRRGGDAYWWLIFRPPGALPTVEPAPPLPDAISRTRLPLPNARRITCARCSHSIECQNPTLFQWGSRIDRRRRRQCAESFQSPACDFRRG